MFFESIRDKDLFSHRGDNLCEPHFHRSVEMLYVLSGKKTVFLNGIKYELSPRDLLVCPPYALHHFPKGENSEQIVVCALSDFCERFEKLCAGNAPQTPVYHDEKGELLPFFEAAQDCKNEILFSGIVNFVLGRYVTNVKFSPIAKNKERLLVEKLVEYIEENYAQEITLRSLAKVFGYSPNYFSLLFKRNFLTSLPQYLNAVRVRKSVPLLKSRNVSDVYFLCGFNNPQQYFLNFKKYYGCTPKEFLKGKT